MTAPAQPIRAGVGWSALAALLFGATAPLVKHASTGAGPLASRALLYLGAAIAAAVGLALHRNRAEAPIRGRQVPALLATALVGGLIAPALLVLGLQRANAASGALLLALEAPFTVLLARLVYGEHIGRRAAAAAVLVFAGALLVSGPGQAGLALGGALLVGAATLAWAVDNIVSRGLADRDPLMVVLGKGGIGGAAAALAALARGEPWPTATATALLLVAGGLGFGVSLQLYLRAQRLMGAARTASVFSLAPFLGTATALVLGAPWPGWSLAAAAVVMGAGVWLHASERHEHLHTHDDLHHDHHHDPMPAGPHSHVHRHGRVVHSHPHSEDAHHRHSH